MKFLNKLKVKIGVKAIRRYLVLSTLLMIPNFFLLYTGRDFSLSLWVLLQSMTFWVATTLLISNLRILAIISIPFLIVLPVECYFINTYGYPSTKFVITSLAETSVQEVTELLSGVWLMGAAYLLLIMSFVFWLFLGLQSVSVVTRRFQLFFLFFLCGVIALWQFAKLQPNAPLSIKQYNLANTFPIGIVYKLMTAGKIYFEGFQDRRLIEMHQFLTKSPVSEMTLILVIGESARPDHWSLNNYSRNTTPKLASRSDIYFMPDLITPWTLTTYSTPLFITRKTSTYQGIFPEKSIFSAYKSVGFSTYWFANQDGLKELMLHVGEADHRKSFNFAVESGDKLAAFDGDMLPSIESAINENKPKKFIVVHTKGSHWDYYLRYPKSFQVFMPDKLDGATGKYNKNQRDRLVNGYDNSILYTDYFLNELIKKLENAGNPSAMVYVSDHGEGLYENNCKIFGHGNDTSINFRTAGLIWVSPKLAENRPSIMSALKKNTKSAISTDLTIFHTLADLGDLDLFDKTNSLLSPDFKTRKRLVNTSAGVIDFDHSAREGDCELVTQQINLPYSLK